MRALLFLNTALVVGAFLIGAPSAAHATLGEPATSVATDAAQMNATAGVTTAHPVPGVPTQNTPASANFTIEQITTADGTVVSEYVGPDAAVFAVTWRGAMPPDVQTLLGAYFKQYRDAADNGAPSPLGLHASSVQAPDVKVETAGHMGFMWGRAYLPARLPAGVTISEIK
jgi:Protein of unknown function (DUF2844)